MDSMKVNQYIRPTKDISSHHIIDRQSDTDIFYKHERIFIRLIR